MNKMPCILLKYNTTSLHWSIVKSLSIENYSKRIKMRILFLWYLNCLCKCNTHLLILLFQKVFIVQNKTARYFLVLVLYLSFLFFLSRENHFYWVFIDALTFHHILHQNKGKTFKWNNLIILVFDFDSSIIMEIIEKQ